MTRHSFKECIVTVNCFWFIYLVVPEIIQGPIDAARSLGENVIFTCNATGVPLPSITWNSESNPAIMPQSDVVTDGGMVRQSQIMVPNLQLEDFENYTCTATNEFGSDNEMALLQCEMSSYLSRNVWQG